jgi:hypothetical protein
MPKRPARRPTHPHSSGACAADGLSAAASSDTAVSLTGRLGAWVARLLASTMLPPMPPMRGRR